MNKLIMPDMDTIYFRAVTPAISSSMVRELHSFGKDVSAYIPAEVWERINA